MKRPAPSMTPPIGSCIPDRTRQRPSSLGLNCEQPGDLAAGQSGTAQEEKSHPGAEKSDTIPQVWDVLPSCFDEIPPFREPASLRARGAKGESCRLSTYSPLNDMDSRRWTTCRRQSSDWETETLIDQSSSRPGSSGTGMASLASPSWQTLYPCPFRKRNPTRFNVRNHERCAKAALGSISELR